AENAVVAEEIVSMHFLEYCQQPEKDEKGVWTLPPIQLQDEAGNSVKIVGTLKDVCAKGLIFHQTREVSNVFKLWPQYLILCQAIELYQLPIVPQLISSKSSKPIVLCREETESKLKTYLSYYFLGLQIPSPLIPDWISDFLKEESESIG